MSDGIKSLQRIKQVAMEHQSAFAANAVQDAIDFVEKSDNHEGSELELAVFYLASVVGQYQQRIAGITARAEGTMAALNSEKA